MSRILMQNANHIVTCDAQDTVVENGDILIDGQEIIAIGKGLDATDATIIDMTGKIIYPGLVNTHHHLFQSFVRNQAGIDVTKLDLMEWLDTIYRAFQSMETEDIYYASYISMADLVKHGCTTIFDHQYCFVKDTDKKAIDRQMEAAQALGVRLHAGRGTNTMPKSEGSTIPDRMVESTEEFIAHTRALIENYHDGSKFSMRQIVVAPCQPVNCYPETFREAVKLARETGTRMHTHLGEGEDMAMMERYGMRTLDWCEQQGFVGDDVWFAHCWETTEAEFDRMAQLGCGVSHCPSAAALGGFPILNIKRMQNQGVTVGIGVDGSATNDGSSLLDSIRVGFMLQMLYAKQRGESVSAYEYLKLATIESAKLLGRASDIGSLEVGKAADLFCLDMTTLEMGGAGHDPKNLIARAGVTDGVAMTMIGGQVVYENGNFPTIDQLEIATIANERCRAVLQRAGL